VGYYLLAKNISAKMLICQETILWDKLILDSLTNRKPLNYPADVYFYFHSKTHLVAADTGRHIYV
jgi:hypothetical protein